VARDPPHPTRTTPQDGDSSHRILNQPYSRTPIIPTEITFPILEKWVLQEPRPLELHEILFNLDSGKIPGIFGESGFDSTFLATFLDAIVSVRDNLEPITKWVSQSVELLDALRKCGRFGIALAFVPTEKIRKAFEAVKEQASVEQKQRLHSVEKFYQ
jgi:hypothetical protein